MTTDAYPPALFADIIAHVQAALGPYTPHIHAHRGDCDGAEPIHEVAFPEAPVSVFVMHAHPEDFAPVYRVAAAGLGAGACFGELADLQLALERACQQRKLERAPRPRAPAAPQAAPVAPSAVARQRSSIRESESDAAAAHAARPDQRLLMMQPPPEAAEAPQAARRRSTMLMGAASSARRSRVSAGPSSARHQKKARGAVARPPPRHATTATTEEDDADWIANLEADLSSEEDTSAAAAVVEEAGYHHHGGAAAAAAAADADADGEVLLMGWAPQQRERPVGYDRPDHPPLRGRGDGGGGSYAEEEADYEYEDDDPDALYINEDEEEDLRYAARLSSAHAAPRRHH